MYRHHRVGIVIPAYNEEGFVGDVIDAVPAWIDRVYVVDDGSTDGTWEEIVSHASRINDREATISNRRSGNGDGEGSPRDSGPVIVTIRHDRNRGAGGAIKTGYLAALDDEIDIVATVDSDGQQNPDDLDALFDPIIEDRAEYAKGNRFLTSHRGGMPRHRYIGNIVLGALTKIASGYWEVGDPQTGFTAISRRALEAIEVEELYEFYGYPNDLLVKLNVASMRVVDVPASDHYGDEVSHIRYRSYIPRVSWMLLRNFLWRLRMNYMVRGFHPLVVAYGVGTIAVLGGVVGFGVLLAMAGSAGRTTAMVAAGGVSLLLVLLGIHSWSWAMVLDREANAALNRPLVGGIDDDEPEPMRIDAPTVSPLVDGGRQEPATEGDCR